MLSVQAKIKWLDLIFSEHEKFVESVSHKLLRALSIQALIFMFSFLYISCLCSPSDSWLALPSLGLRKGKLTISLYYLYLNHGTTKSVNYLEVGNYDDVNTAMCSLLTDCYMQRGKISSRSKWLKNIEEMFPRYYMRNCVFNCT